MLSLTMARSVPKRARGAAASVAFDVVVMGTSAGGLAALGRVLEALPRDFPAAVVVVQHLLADHHSYSATLLSGRTPLRVKQAEDQDALHPGVVYVAPPGSHLLVQSGHLALSHTAAVRFSRPSIDVTFESAAAAYGRRCVGIVLSGANRDGADGLRTIKQAGGYTLVQDPKEAQFAVMPAAAVATGCADRVLPLADIGPELSRICAPHAA